MSRRSIGSTWRTAALIVPDLRAQHLLPAEREELPGQRRCLVGRGDDALHHGHQVQRIDRAPGSRAQVVGKQVRVAADGEQHVVEIVGDAAREATHRLHLLGLEQLALERLAGADVDHGGEDQPPAGRLQGSQADLDRELVAVLVPPGEVEADAHGASDRACQVAVTVGDVDVGEALRKQPLHRFAQQLLTVEPERLGDAGVRVHDPPRRVHGDDGIGRGVQQRVQIVADPDAAVGSFHRSSCGPPGHAGGGEAMRGHCVGEPTVGAARQHTHGMGHPLAPHPGTRSVRASANPSSQDERTPVEEPKGPP